MKISVIVPFLNEEKYIETCIKSLLNQDFPKNDYELIFVDNGSTDGSDNIVKKYRKIQYLHWNKFKSSYKCRNLAMKKAKGTIFAFTDADCEASRGWLKAIYNGFLESDIGIVVGERRFNTSVGVSLKIIQDYENSKIKYLIDNKYNEKIFGFTNNMAIMANLCKKVGSFKEPHGDTRIVNEILRSNIKSITYSTDMVITHLEINSIFDWLKKIYGYASLNNYLSKNINYKQLSLIDNLRIAKAANLTCYGPIRWLVLISSWVCYKVGLYKSVKLS